MIMCKKGGHIPVSISGFRNELIIAIIIASGVLYEKYGVDFVITSGSEDYPDHMRGSLHYSGSAVDFRSRDIPQEDRTAVLEDIKDALPSEFDVVLEGSHFHMEYQPKGPKG